MLEQCVRDVRRLLTVSGDAPGDDIPDADVVYLWDEKGDSVMSGADYGTPSGFGTDF